MPQVKYPYANIENWYFLKFGQLLITVDVIEKGANQKAILENCRSSLK